jgi:inositol oxygenase
MVLEVVLSGFGRAGKIHFKNLMTSKKFKLTHIIEMYDISKEIPEEVKYVNYNDKNQVNEIFNNNSIKALIIASPTSTHYELIMQSLKNNKHVFVEKPIVEDCNQIKECFELADKNNLKLFVGYNRRFDPKIKSIHKRIRNGEIGFVNYALTISRDYPYPTDSFLKISGGIFHDCATHDIDYMNWILNDKPISVTVNVEDNNNTKEHNFDHVSINFKYSLGTIVCLNLSRISSSYDQRCEFYGSEGEIINKHFKQKAKLSFPQRYAKAFESELKEFYKCIINDTSPLVTKEDCLNNYTIANACEESYDKQKKITIKYGGGFRNYEFATQSVADNYLKARKNQTLDFVLNMKNKFSKLETKMDIWEILEDLNNLTDVSDPDCSHPNLYHAIQTAEMIREDGHPEWMQLIGLIHDIGKIMYKKGNDEEGTGIKEQWAMVGDTFVVGCKLPQSIIFPEFNAENPDMENNEYNTHLGIYEEKCGMDNLHCSWGHDEYLYTILKSEKNPNNLPDEALYIARFHSLYLYHDKKEYLHFQSEKDKNMFSYLKEFNKYDLYSKCDEIYDIEKLKDYYVGLINKFFKNTFLYI